MQCEGFKERERKQESAHARERDLLPLLLLLLLLKPALLLQELLLLHLLYHSQQSALQPRAPRFTRQARPQTCTRHAFVCVCVCVCAERQRTKPHRLICACANAPTQHACPLECKRTSIHLLIMRFLHYNRYI
jgi:hypothetical protein